MSSTLTPALLFAEAFPHHLLSSLRVCELVSLSFPYLSICMRSALSSSEL